MKQETFLEKLGFQDQELKTAKHDEMIISIFENPNMIINSNSFVLKKITLEEPIVKTNFSSTYIIGYLDVFMSFKTDKGNHYLGIEIKPKIENIGELLRQMQTYKTYCHYNLGVCCPDDRFKKIIESQGFLFFKYPSK